MGPLCRGPVWMPITPKRGFFLHADSRPRKQQTERRHIRSKGLSGWDWTCQPFPVNSLMQVAVEDPKGFATLFSAAFFRPPTKAQLAAAARRGREQRQQEGREP
jgi:hypothetical protein